ncbi:hypothetical protein EJ06DRAFT_519865 [Trichodelitschia bisporula]|uniref:NACHT domain-containing protein n=1 Tax=Trichodelitschia bisporula TaxID=703511 RepID=A0A6G1I3W1_9PEZI|nr:hypothetical protein EJ06DRAFT_519865 [Trichodelitschia bisporula]
MEAIGIATAIIQFIGFGAKTIKGAHQIYVSTTSASEFNASLKVTVTEMSIWRRTLNPPDMTASTYSPEEPSIFKLAEECQRLANELRELLEIPENALSDAAKQLVLGQLYFGDIHARMERIDPAHAKTFEWIFDDAQGPELREMTNGVSFVHWLKSETGIFHITGKLFLKKCPEVIPHVFPEEWNTAKELVEKSALANSRSDNIFALNMPLTRLSMRNALDKLIKVKELYQDRCFCFFIDGLDEFEETHREDYFDMVNLVHSWTEAAPDHVKLCVSSRDYNVFRNAFDAKKRLRLQDFTRGDISNFVSARFSSFSTSKNVRLTEVERGSLVTAVTERGGNFPLGFGCQGTASWD